jgi:hypothetical protein
LQSHNRLSVKVHGPLVFFWLCYHILNPLTPQSNFSIVDPPAPPLITKTAHAFDLEAEAESIPETTESEPEPQDYPDDGLGPLMDHDDDDDNGDDNGVVMMMPS